MIGIGMCIFISMSVGISAGASYTLFSPKSPKTVTAVVNSLSVLIVLIWVSAFGRSAPNLSYLDSLAGNIFYGTLGLLISFGMAIGTYLIILSFPFSDEDRREQ